jgi:hypothetical protein
MKVLKFIFNIAFLISAIFGGFFGVFLIELIILQITEAVDPESFVNGCVYTGKIFNLFYTVSSNTGYEPEQSVFSMYFGGFIGLVFGVWVIYKRHKAGARVTQV